MKRQHEQFRLYCHNKLRQIFFKIYSKTTDKIETAALSYLKNKINVPGKLLFYDGKQTSVSHFAYAIMEFLDGVTFINHVRS